MIMSTQSGHVYLPSTHIGKEPTAAPERLAWQQAFGRFREKLRRRRQLRDLFKLDDRLLADVGITREQAFRAARKARWT
jgi:uncharacterized protein YjiS (DUF1127 family)